MKSILDYGKKGIEKAGEPIIVAPGATVGQIADFVSIAKRLPKDTKNFEDNSGIKRAMDVRVIKLDNPKLFELMHRAALLEPMVYAQFAGQRVMGMLSPNYDEHGEHRLDSLKIIPLRVPYPLKSGRPDARTAVMLAGAVGAERQGSGGHNVPIASDFEHRLTIVGAVAIGNPGVAIGHLNHGVRRRTSLATGLTDGSLGDIYSPNSTEHDFRGYGNPLIIDKNKVGPNDYMYIPDSFLDEHDIDAFGIAYKDAQSIMFGAGLQALYAKRGVEAASADIQRLALEVR